MTSDVEARIAQRVEQRIARIVRRVVATHFAHLGIDEPTDALRLAVERDAEAFVLACYADEIERRVRARCVERLVDGSI